MMRLKEVALSNASPEAKIAGLAVLLDKELLRLSEVVLNTKKLQGPQGEQGLQGPKGEQGDRGFDGANGKDGADGADGRQGEDGKDGVGVADAKVDFDGSLVITLTNGREINAGDVIPESVADKIKVVKSGGGNSQTVLDAIDEINAIISTYGTMALQNKTSVDIEGGTIDGTAIGAAVPAAGVFTTLSTGALTATGQTSLGGAAGSEGVRVLNTPSAVNYWEMQGRATNSAVRMTAAGADTNIIAAMSSKGSSPVIITTNSYAQAQLYVAHTASAVNYVQVTGAATGNSPLISAQGSDANVNITVQGKGTGSAILLANSTGNAALQTDGGLTAIRAIPRGASGDTWLDVQRTSGLVALSAASGVTNGAFLVQSKGTGAIDLAAGSRGVNISNGGTVTALTRTNAGSGYTSFPTVAISAPTTAGGVQATASITMTATSATLVAGGTGYTVNDVLTVVGGTFTAATQITVNAVSGGVITTVTVGPAGGSYSVLPSNPVSVTGGTGSGATFNLAYGITSAGLTITNAGSGYVEQPTVTFSGGGGSGAAAYASVGGGVTIRSLGSTGNQSIDFAVAGSLGNSGLPVLRIRDTNSGSGANAGFLMVQSNNGYAQLITQGPATTHLNIASAGDGRINFNTRGGSEVTQMRVSDTASAVNYVQVTGAATGGITQISAQGSDSTTYTAIGVKGGSGYISFFNGGSHSNANTLFRVLGTGLTQANYPTVTPSAAGSGPVFGVAGSDTNIDLTLTPKGTGNVRFGTLTASADAPITGYITIKDSGGTVRKLAVVA